MATGEREEAAAQGERRRHYHTLEHRCFWSAGSYEEIPGSSRLREERLDSSDLERARVHPKFLHTNATSHKWAFGAVAELVDNAVDEICNGVTFVLIDKINNPRDKSPILLVQDDGGGMGPDGLRHCMSLGYSTKKSKKTIGQYGNGFKTSTMRLGADVIVFTCANGGSSMTQSIGLLSYTYLRRTMKDDIVVPMVDFKICDGQKVPLVYGSQENWDSNLRTILEWCPFSSEEELMMQFSDVGSHGTKVLIYNLWMNDNGLLELDFDDDDEDILLRDQASAGARSQTQREVVQKHISYTLKYSLREYMSILYLRKFSRFQIILRGKQVPQFSNGDMLKFGKDVIYKPVVRDGSESVSVKITIGFAKEAPILGIFGFNVYHKNRLIMPFWRVLEEGSSRGRCVVGFLEANFIEPAHDKQDFERTHLFLRLASKLKQLTLEFWKDHCHRIGYQPLTPELRNSIGKSNKSTIPSVEKELRANQVVIDLDDDCEPERTIQHISGHAAEDGFQFPTFIPPDPDQQCSGDQAKGFQAEAFPFMDPLVENIAKENAQLMARRTELLSSTSQLKMTIEQLERVLEKERTESAQLAAEVEIQRQRQLP